MYIKKDDINIIRKIAWSFHYTTGIEYEELHSQAAAAWCEAMLLYKPGKSKRTTWAWTYIQRDLINFIKREKNYRIEVDSISELKLVYHIPDDDFSDVLKTLPKDCKLLTKIIFQNPERFNGDKPKLNRGKLVEELRNEGWSWSRIWDNIRKMKSTLNENKVNCII